MQVAQKRHPTLICDLRTSEILAEPPLVIHSRDILL